MAESKQLRFSKPAILKKILGLVLGLLSVGLLLRRAMMWLNLLYWTVRRMLKNMPEMSSCATTYAQDCI